ncbi:MAG: hypothetical protein WC855_13285 [Thermodesulfovibrionales bacterium]
MEKEADVEHFWEKRQEVKRDHNKKIISVKHFFWGGKKPLYIKIRASYKNWSELESTFLKGKMTFSIIRPYISLRTPKKDIAELQGIYNKSPENFIWHFYDYFISAAHTKNPLKVKQPRGGSPYPDKDYFKMTEIRRTARFLYLLLQHWLSPKKKFPAWLKSFLLDKYNLSQRKNGITHKKVKWLTQVIIQEHFDLKTQQVHPDNFYRKFIADKKLTAYKKALESINYLPIRDPLLSLFSKK